MDPYMKKTEALLREGGRALERRAASLSSPAPSFSVLARRRKLMKLKARYADVNRRFEMLQDTNVESIADAKVGLEKSWAAFCTELGSHS
jgi:hypothetical protein